MERLPSYGEVVMPEELLLIKEPLEPLQNFCLENPMDGGAWWAAVYGVAQGRTRLKRLSSSSSSSGILEKEMATHSSVLAWRIPGTGEPDGLLSLGSHRVGHD